LPSNELCMGCGWTAKGTDYARVAAVEVVNGGAVRAQGGKADGPFSGIPFWERRLNECFSPTAIGGSDNHKPDSDPAEHPALAFPTTVVFAAALSERAILDAIRAGRVFIDVEGAGDILLELTAACGEARAMMGESLPAPKGADVAFALHVEGLAGACVDVVMDGEHGVALAGQPIEHADQTLVFNLPGDGARHWLRADIRSADGERTLAIGNPIYLNR